MGGCFRGEKVMAWNHGLRSVAGLSAADMGLVGTWSRFFLFHRLVSDLLINAILLLLLLLFSPILSEEDSERMRKNNNIIKKSNAPFWLYFEWEKLFWGGQCGKKITRVFPADDQKDSKTSQSGPLLQDSEGKVAWELDVQFELMEILCSNQTVFKISQRMTLPWSRWSRRDYIFNWPTVRFLIKLINRCKINKPNIQIFKYSLTN